MKGERPSFQHRMGSALRRYFITPRSPNNAAAFLDAAFSVVDVSRKRGGFSLATSALTQLPDGLLVPSFDSQNVAHQDELRSIILQTVEAAGLSNKKRWSVALPEGVARTLLIGLESRPSNRRELTEMVSWKVERSIAVPSSELRISRQRISPADGEERYFVTAAHEQVITEYETLFKGIGWHSGIFLPRHVGEVQWLLWDESQGDKMLVSGNRSGFTTIILQNGEPALVRSHVCEPESRFDELYRIALYYKDRMDQGGKLSRALVLGDVNPAEAQRVIGDATGLKPQMLDPAEFGFDLRGEPIRFEHVAAAAGLATLAWQ